MCSQGLACNDCCAFSGLFPTSYQIAVEETEGSGGFDADSDIPLFSWRQDIALLIYNLIERSSNGIRAFYTARVPTNTY